jgi:hypothetical protein
MSRVLAESAASDAAGALKIRVETTVWVFASCILLMLRSSRLEKIGIKTDLILFSAKGSSVSGKGEKLGHPHSYSYNPRSEVSTL